MTEKPVANATTTTDAKTGSLYGDAGLNTILRQLRQAVSDPIAGNAVALDEMAELGVSTGAASSTINADSVAGKLTFDSAKLTAALDADPLAVRKLLGGITGTNGFASASRASSTRSRARTASCRSASAPRTRRSRASRDDLIRFDKRMRRKQDALSKQWSALETATRRRPRAARPTSRASARARSPRPTNVQPLQARPGVGDQPGDATRSPDVPDTGRPHLSTYASPQAYREAAVLTASPVQLVVMLYDGVERFLRQAEVVMGEGNVAQAHDRMQRAEAIIDELLRTLDKSAGQVAERLEAIYIFCKRLLMEARLERDADQAHEGPLAHGRAARVVVRARRDGRRGMSTVLQAAAALVAIAEQGCVLAAEGRLDDLGAQQEAWDARRRAARAVDRTAGGRQAARAPRRRAAGRAGRHPRRRTGRGRGGAGPAAHARAAARRATRTPSCRLAGPRSSASA